MTTPEVTLGVGDWTVGIGPDGLLASLQSDSASDVPAVTSGQLIVEAGAEQFVLADPVSIEERGGIAHVRHELPAPLSCALELTYQLIPLTGGGLAIETTVSIDPTQDPFPATDLAVRLPGRLTIGDDVAVFAPRKNGEGRTTQNGIRHGYYAWEMAGKTRMFLGGYTDPLGLPLVSESAEGSPWRLTWCTDPYFSAAFQLFPTSMQHPEQRELNWVYSGAVPFRGPESRSVYACVHRGDERDAIQAFYDSALAHVPPGPRWLHDIALVHYDYFSKSGRGWYEDVDTFAARIAPDRRHQVCLCLHGWYDRLGRYSTDEDRREIVDEWRLIRGHDLSGHDGTVVSRDEVARMLEYAKSQGFRVALYYGDGLIAGSDWARETFPPAATLRAEGWDEGVTHSVLLNPSHYEVRRWFLDYTRALLTAFGEHIDALVWDETYFFAIGELGPAACPGYLDRDFMTLTRDITRTVHDHREEIAFLGSDNVGVTYTCDGTGRGAAAYSLVADGCWQDSACNPEAWPFGVFPNFRNVHWSCNWWPVRNFPATRYGVEKFGTPVATSNGFGENRSLHEYPAGALDEILAVFGEHAAAVPRERGWLGEDDPRLPGPVGTHDLEGPGKRSLT